MAQFITISDRDDRDYVYKVNVDHIVAYVALRDGTRVTLTNGSPVTIKEMVNELDELIQNVRRDSVRSGG